MDVVALYTSIPPQEAILNIQKRLIETQFNLHGMKHTHIVTLLNIILSNTYFTYENEIYKQRFGLPMGNSLSGLLAILFMDTLEKASLTQCHNIGLYKRYVDDILCITDNKSNADDILNIFNNQHPSIKFEIEYPDTNNTLSLLDFSVQLNPDGKTTFNFYTKNAKRNLFINYKSALPFNTKLHSVINELNRITERCSRQTDLDVHLHNFKSTLTLNDYPTDFYDKSINIKKHKRPKKQRNINEEFVYLKFPFINDRINNMCRNLFHKLNLPIRLYDHSNTLRKSLSKKREHQCTLKECKMKNKDCNTKNCVYQITCSCGETYIGSTIRPLHIRYKEHLTNEQSPVYQHIKNKNKHTQTVKILSRENNITKLRIKEAYLIKSLRPTMNNKEERATPLLY